VLKKSNSGANNIVGLLGKGTQFDGKLTFEGTLRIDGTFTGEILTNGALVVGEGALVNAEVKADSVVVCGEVHGNLNAATKMEIKRGAKLYGNISTPSLIIDEGVIFEGSCHMEDGKPSREEPDS